jgi:nucleoside-diphosphate-sugar epimerase
MTLRGDLSGRKVLVTGASGVLGSRVVAALSERGCFVRGLVRKTSRTDHLDLPNVTLIRGDVAEVESLNPAFDGAEYVIHAAADTRGVEREGALSTVLGTRNVLALCRNSNVRKLVYISSCSVYGTADYREGQVVTEESALERFPDKRGHYSSAKLRAEQLVAAAIAEGRVPIVCLRPGIFFGPGAEVFNPVMGFAAGRKLFAIIGHGESVLPLVSIANLVDAIVTCMRHEKSSGKVYNVIDRDVPTKNQYVDSLLKRLYPDAFFFSVPYRVLSWMVRVQEVLLGMVGRDPVLTMYRLESSQRSVIYDASKIRRELDWNPPVMVRDSFERVIRAAGRDKVALES